MATPLSDEIRALITYANETTEAGDTKLGDCVKTLCDGFNGDANAPSSPLVIPQGALSSRLSALLAYANETTGAGDTTMGDAIKTLCDGYGSGEDSGLVFFDTLNLPALNSSIDCSINLGRVLAEPYTDLYYSFKNNSGRNAGDFLGGDTSTTRKVYISNYVVRFAFGSSPSNYINSSLNNANMKDVMLHVYGTKIDMTILSTSATTSYDTVQCSTLDGSLFLNKNINTNAQASRIFHSLRVENNGKVLHDIVPAMNGAGLIGVYDKVAKRFYYSETGQDYYILQNTL